MKTTEYRVGDVKCIDVDGIIKGVTIGCEGRTLVRLIFDGSIPHQQTDDLARMPEKMKLKTVIVQKDY